MTAPLELQVPGDKSLSHRALLFAALAHGESEISGVLPGEDCQSTATCLRALGVMIPTLPSDGAPVRIVGAGPQGLKAPAELLDCGNSGTTARLLLGLLAGAGISATLDGDASLRRRPMRRVTAPLEQMGARFTELGAPGCLPIRIEARVTRRGGGAGDGFTWRSPVASAQVKSALLLAGLASGNTVTVLEPEPSRDHTERMLRRMGVVVDTALVDDGWVQVTLKDVPERLSPLHFHVPGDPSSAAFLAALTLLGGVRPLEPVRILNVGMNPTRSGVFDVFQRMGGRLSIDGRRAWNDPAGEPVADLLIFPPDDLTQQGGRRGIVGLRGTEVGGAEIPSLIDEVPLIAALAARAEGVTSIRDAAELRVKESDRIDAMAANLRALGVTVETFPDGLAVHGASAPLRGAVQTFHDHRIAMAFGVLGALPENTIEVDDPQMVEVSFPGFWTLLRTLTSPEPHAEAVGGRRLVITLDGPAGSGKSTTARAVAARLGYGHLDSGALYRAVTLALVQSGRPESAWEGVTLAELDAFDVTLDPQPRAEDGTFRVRIGGVDPGEALRSAQVTGLVSTVARIPAVRAWLLETQRRTGRRGGVVADGRDMGTVVFPDADLKIFLDADLEERARRRWLESPKGPSAALEDEARALQARDEADRNRPVAPLRPADDAIRVDTTGLAFDEQVEHIVRLARDRVTS